MPNISNMIAIPITQTINFDALSNHICIDAVNHELVDKASKIGFTLFARALKIVKITNALTIFVAISPISPSRGKINVHIYKAIVIGIRPIGLLKAFNISSSIFDSVLSASLPRAFNIIEIINPRRRKANKITAREEIIEPKSIPKKPVFQTSVISFIKLSILLSFILRPCL